jgi:hypothetical protein
MMTPAVEYGFHDGIDRNHLQRCIILVTSWMITPGISLGSSDSPARLNRSDHRSVIDLIGLQALAAAPLEPKDVGRRRAPNPTQQWCKTGLHNPWLYLRSRRWSNLPGCSRRRAFPLVSAYLYDGPRAPTGCLEHVLNIFTQLDLPTETGPSWVCKGHAPHLPIA